MSASSGPRRTRGIGGPTSARRALALILVLVAALIVAVRFVASSSREHASPPVTGAVVADGAVRTDGARELAAPSLTTEREAAADPMVTTRASATGVIETRGVDVAPGATAWVVGQVRARGVPEDHEWGGLVELWEQQRRIASTALPKSGAFEFRDVPTNAYTVVVQAFGFDPKTEPLFVIPSGQACRIDVWVTRLSKLSVDLLTPDGRPLFGALDLAQLDVSEHLRPVLTSTPTMVGAPLPADAVVLVGRGESRRNSSDALWFEFTLDGQASGWCSVVLENLVLDTVPFRPETRVVACRVAPSALTPQTGRLHLTVREERGGAPCGGATVDVIGSRKSKRSGTTDKDGLARVELVIAGVVEVSVSKSGFVSQRVTAMVEPGRETDLGVVVLKSTVSARGHLVLPADLMPVDRQKAIQETLDRTAGQVSPLLTAGIEIWSLDLSAVPLDEVRGRESWKKLQGIHARVNLDGTFEFHGLAPIEYAVGCSRLNLPTDAARVRTGGDPDWTLVDLRQGGRDGIVLSLSARAIEEFRKYRRAQAEAQRAAEQGR